MRNAPDVVNSSLLHSSTVLYQLRRAAKKSSESPSASRAELARPGGEEEAAGSAGALEGAVTAAVGTCRETSGGSGALPGAGATFSPSDDSLERCRGRGFLAARARLRRTCGICGEPGRDVNGVSSSDVVAVRLTSLPKSAQSWSTCAETLRPRSMERFAGLPTSVGVGGSMSASTSSAGNGHAS